MNVMEILRKSINDVIKIEGLENDSGIEVFKNGLSDCKEIRSAAVIILDFYEALRRRNRLTAGAKIVLTAWKETRETSLLNSFVKYLIFYKWNLDSTIVQDFVDFIKTNPKERQFSTEENHILFSCVERLCACTAMQDTELLKCLASEIYKETGQPHYAIIIEYISIFGKYNKDEDVALICILRKKLSEGLFNYKNLNPETEPLINYLITVTYARTFLAAKTKLTKRFDICHFCSNYEYKWLADFDEDFEEYSQVTCEFCSRLPAVDCMENFHQSLKSNLGRYSYLPAARLFWDLHEKCDFGHNYRGEIADETAMCRSYYETGNSPDFYIDSDFSEKT